jgi:hypothetical protein
MTRSINQKHNENEFCAAQMRTESQFQQSQQQAASQQETQLVPETQLSKMLSVELSPLGDGSLSSAESLTDAANS